MGRKVGTKNKSVKKEKSEEVELKENDVVGGETDRKAFLREHIISHLEEVQPELDRKFDMSKVVEFHGTRGSFRNYMDGDFKPEDKKVLREILQDLKVEGILLHVAGTGWARLK